MENRVIKIDDYGKSKEGPYGCMGIYPKRIQWINKVGWLTMFMFAVACVYSCALVGAISASITTIERRFGLNSRTSGIILSSHDIGFIISIIPLERLLRNCDRGKVLGWAFFCMSLSSLMHVIPHFATEAVIPVTSNMTNDIFCNADVRQSTESASNQQLWAILFIGVGIISGFGMGPIRTVGQTCIQSEATAGRGAFNMGLFSIGLATGPLIGGLLTSYFLQNFWCDISNKQVELDPADPNWIGAWWIPFLICGIIGLILAIPVFGFPNQFPGASEIIKEKEAHNDVYMKNEENKHNSQSGLTDYILILKNPAWVIGTVARTCDNICYMSIYLYGIKYLQVQYSISAAYATMLNNAGRAGSIITGFLMSLVLRNFKYSTRTCFIVSGTLCLLSVVVLVPTIMYSPCQNPTISGVFDARGKPIYPPVLETDCNSACSCSRNSFYPICDVSTNVTYLTPCDAGCKSITDGNLEDCSCADASIYFPNQCETNCNTMFIFLIGYISSYCLNGAAVPLTLPAVTDTVESRLKSVQMGLTLMSVRAIGGVGGPIFSGILFDNACTIWQTDNDGKQGSCYIYDHEKLTSSFLWLPNIAKLTSAVCYFTASALVQRKNKITKKTDL